MFLEKASWILGNGQRINFWYDNWIEDSPLIHNISSDMEDLIEEKVKASDFITPTKEWDTNSLVNILPGHIINKINAIPIPVVDLNDRILFASCGDYSIKTTT